MSAELDILKIMWESSFTVKLILILLVFMSLISWSIFLKKRRLFKIIMEEDQKFRHVYEKEARLSKISEESKTFKASALAKMYGYGYSELLRILDKISHANDMTMSDYFSRFGATALERSLRQGAGEVQKKLESQAFIISSIATISPFIGLFGTVWGIISAFTGLTRGGGATIESIAPGIAEALVTTAVGLIVAIPAVVFFNAINQRISLVNSYMEQFAQELLNRIERSTIFKGHD